MYRYVTLTSVPGIVYLRKGVVMKRHETTLAIFLHFHKFRFFVIKTTYSTLRVKSQLKHLEFPTGFELAN